jgi:hypothetical protein
MLISPLTTPFAAKTMIRVTPIAMMAPCPKFSSDMEVWLLTAISSHSESVPS